VRIDEAQISDLRSVLDGLRADFALAPLPGEPSSREDLHLFNPEARLKEGDIFSYRSCAVHQLISLEYSSSTGQCHIVHTSYHASGLCHKT
jgi:uncharacterized Fe-S cluster-containing protein